jgi:hypothetical protein
MTIAIIILVVIGLIIISKRTKTNIPRDVVDKRIKLNNQLSILKHHQSFQKVSMEDMATKRNAVSDLIEKQRKEIDTVCAKVLTGEEYTTMHDLGIEVYNDELTMSDMVRIRQRHSHP